MHLLLPKAIAYDFGLSYLPSLRIFNGFSMLSFMESGMCHQESLTSMMDDSQLRKIYLAFPPRYFTMHQIGQEYCMGITFITGWFLCIIGQKDTMAAH